jgi:hypothetical protein
MHISEQPQEPQWFIQILTMDKSRAQPLHFGQYSPSSIFEHLVHFGPFDSMEEMNTQFFDMLSDEELRGVLQVDEWIHNPELSGKPSDGGTLQFDILYSGIINGTEVYRIHTCDFNNG